MDLLMKIWAWLMHDGSMYLLALLAISEALASIPWIEASSIFQLIVNTLKYIKQKLLPNKP